MMGAPEHVSQYSPSSLPSLEILPQAQEAHDLPFINGEKSTSISLYSAYSLIFYDFYKNSII